MKSLFHRIYSLKRYVEFDKKILFIAAILTLCCAKLFFPPEVWYTQTNARARMDFFAQRNAAPLFLSEDGNKRISYEYPDWCQNSCLSVYFNLPAELSEQTLQIKAQNDGMINLTLKSPFFQVGQDRQKAYVTYKRLQINENEILPVAVTVWHDMPFPVNIPVRKGDIVTVSVEASVPQLAVGDIYWGRIVFVFVAFLSVLAVMRKKISGKAFVNGGLTGLAVILGGGGGLSVLFPRLSPLFLFFLSVSAYYLCFCLLKSAYRLLNVRLEPYQKKTIFVIFALTVLAYLCSVLCYDRIYIWDATAYFDHQNKLVASFQANIMDGLRQIVQSVWYWDYNELLCLLLAAPYQLLPTPTNNQYVLIYAVLAVLPVQFWIVVANIVVGNLCNFKYRKQFFYIGCLLACAFPALHLSAFRGQPDIIGLAFCLPCFLLTLEYDFKRLDVKRLTFMLVLGALAFLMRRWYIYSVVSWFPVYGLYCLVSVKSKEEFKAVLKNEAVFALSSIVSVSLLLHPMLKHIFEADYGKYYSSWNWGGFAFEYGNQINHIGYMAAVLMLPAVVVGAVRRNKIVLLSVSGFFLAVFLFTRIQNIEEHQTLLLIPNYFFLLFYSVGVILSCSGKYVETVCGLFILYAFCNAAFPFFHKDAYHLFPVFSKGFARVMNKKDIQAVSDFILEKTALASDVYILTTNIAYQPEHFRQVYYGDKRRKLNLIIQEPIDMLGSKSFPLSIFRGKYVVVLSPFIHAHLIPHTMFQAFEAVKDRQYALVKKFEFEDGVAFFVYERIRPVDREEVTVYKKAFEPFDQKFPELYGNILDSFMKSLGR